MNRLVSLIVHGLFCNINQRGECLQHIATPNPNASRKDSVMAFKYMGGFRLQCQDRGAA